MPKPILHVKIKGYPTREAIEFFYKDLTSRVGDDFHIVVTSDTIEMEVMTEETQKAKILRETIDETDLMGIYGRNN